MPHTHSESVVIRRTIILAAALSGPCSALAGVCGQSATMKREPAWAQGAVRSATASCCSTARASSLKAIFKVYTGLYLGAKAATTEAVLATPGAKRMHTS